MTHLYIELNTGSTEEVTSAIISKLYELASSGDLDNSSDLKGRLHSVTARDTHVTYLTSHFNNLYITADKQYITFADPEVERVLTSLFGDGTGVTSLDMLAVTSLGWNSFNGNNNIVTFNELGRFTTLTRIDTCVFSFCVNLTSIDLSNILYIGGEAFKSTNLTGVINLPNIISIGDSNRSMSFGYCTNITEINIGSNFNADTTYMANVFNGCTNLEKVSGLSSITHIPSSFAYNCGKLSDIDIDWSKILTINNYAFYECTNLPTENISIPNLTSLGDNAFRGCKNIKTVSNLGLITSLAENTFRDCDKLTSYTLPTTLKTFLCEAFYGCDIDSIVGIEGIETMVFGQYNNKNKNFKYIELPSTVTDMGRFFHNSLNQLNTSNKVVCVIKATTPPSLGYYNSQGGGTVYDSTAAGASILGTRNGASRCFSGIYVPNNSLNNYLAASGAWLESEIQDLLKPISQLETDSPSSWVIYQQGLSNQ